MQSWVFFTELAPKPAQSESCNVSTRTLLLKDLRQKGLNFAMQGSQRPSLSNMCWWCGNPLCGLCSIITCMCRPVKKKYDELPLWAQCLVSFIFVGIPCSSPPLSWPTSWIASTTDKQLLPPSPLSSSFFANPSCFPPLPAREHADSGRLARAAGAGRSSLDSGGEDAAGSGRGPSDPPLDLWSLCHGRPLHILEGLLVQY